MATTAPSRRLASAIDLELGADRKVSASFTEKEAWPGVIGMLRLRDSSIEQGLYAFGGVRFGRAEPRQTGLAP